MDIKDVIEGSVNVKKYWLDKIPLELVEDIIDSGRYAVCADGEINWKVVIIVDDKLKDKISNCCMRQGWISKAPVILVLCSDIKHMEKYYGKKAEHYGRHNTLAAAENMRIAATSLGVSTCWVNFFEEKSLRRVLKIPDSVTPEVVLTLGYSDLKTRMPNRTSLDKLVYFNEWDNTVFPEDFWPIGRKTEKIQEEIDKGFKKLREKAANLLKLKKKK